MKKKQSREQYVRSSYVKAPVCGDELFDSSKGASEAGAVGVVVN